MSAAPAYDPTGPLVHGLAAVEASAGTGKTWSISSLVARLVAEREGFALERCLVVTFTRAATAELAERVRARLEEARQVLAGTVGPCDDEVLQHLDRHADDLPGGRQGALSRLEQALRDVDDAAITTLHGFAQRVLRTAALAADAEPALEVDDDRQASLLLEEVVGDWHVALVRDADPLVHHVLRALKLDRDGLLGLARTVVGETVPHVVPTSAPDHDPAAAARAAVDRFAAALRAAAEGDAAWLAAHAMPLTRSMRLGPERLPAARARMQEALDAGRLPHKDDLKHYAPAAVEGSTRLRKAGAEPPPTCVAVGRLLEDLSVVETVVRVRLATHVQHEVAARRTSQGRTGFEGLLRGVDRALDDEATRAELRAAIGTEHDVVLVDEFQDTDPVQWGILRRLFEGAEHIVVVGDPKQAIYGWRGADLRTYLDAVADADAASTLRTNWRSDGPYVAACNALLGTPDPFGTSGQAHEVGYVAVDTPADRAAARLHDAQGAARSGIELVLHHREDEGKPLELGVARRRVAAWTAEDVVHTLAAGWRITTGTTPGRDGGDDGDGDGDGHTASGEVASGDESQPATRAVGPRDCVVLVRTNREARLVAAALRARGVLPTLGGGQDVFASDEAAAVEHLLAALLDRGRERLVRRVLVGPLAALDARQLAALDEADREAWGARLGAWHATWDDHGIAALLERATRDGGAEERLATRPDGERILTNVRHLAELLHVAARDEALGTHALLGWLRARRADALAEEGRAPVERELRLERDDEAVRVLTVHAAKGLEFPLVWAPFLWSSEVRARDRGNRHVPFVVNDDETGGRRTIVLHPAAMLDSDADAPPELQRLWRAKDRADWQAGLRLAYVALTRAVHRCVVDVGAFKDVVGSSAWHLLHADAVDLRYEPGERPVKVLLDDDELRAPLAALAQHEAVRLEDREPVEPPVTAWTPPAPTHADLRVATWSGRALDRAWGRTSYTRLLDRRTAPAAADATAEDARDHDEDVAESPSVAWGPSAPDTADAAGTGDVVPLQDVPRGAAWGTFLHGVLEHVDFGASEAQLRTLVRDEARRTTLPVTAAHHDVVAHGLHRALATPLGPALDDLRLADVPHDDRLDELRFTLALAGRDGPVRVRDLAAVLERHAAASGDVPLDAAAAHLRAGGDGPAVHGLMVGAIDLVLREHLTGQPRWWVVDYKSNGLGRWVDDPGDGGRTWVERAGDHHPTRVLASMLDHDYLLQAHLYVVALHRFLRSRLGAAYDYDRHVGGWAYLYLRGMVGPDVPRTGDGRPHGVATGRPSRELVEDLDAVLTPVAAS